MKDKTIQFSLFDTSTQTLSNVAEEKSALREENETLYFAGYSHLWIKVPQLTYS